MQGEHVTLWAYARGEAARDLPYQLWRLIEDSPGDWDRIMWGEADTDSRVRKHGDLVHWVAYMQDKIWLMAADNATGDICGLFWFADVRPGFAIGAIWMAPRYRGKPHSREVGRLATAWGHAQGWSTIMVATPWPEARNLAKRVGYKDITRIPKLLGPDTWLLEHKHE